MELSSGGEDLSFLGIQRHLSSSPRFLPSTSIVAAAAQHQCSREHLEPYRRLAHSQRGTAYLRPAPMNTWDTNLQHDKQAEKVPFRV